MGPMSVATGPGGVIVVLDEVNHRLVRRRADGSLEGTTDITLRAAQDLAIGKDGSLAVLDRLGDKAIALYSARGESRGQLRITGNGVEEPGLVTGVFVDGNDVYVEREHGTLVKIGDTNGVPADVRSELPGRPSRDGLSLLHAGIIDGPAGRTMVSAIDRASGEHRFTRELRFKAQVTSIVLLDSDPAGTIFFAVELHEDPSTDYVMLECLEPKKGVPIGSAILPANTMPEETFRDLSVTDDGAVLYAIRASDGVTYRRYTCGDG